jgi:glycosyltransferase involved in cell wall biosynthesis
VFEKNTPGVMQVVDSLDLGGTETVAVNLANELPQERFRKYLCSTRSGNGSSPLAEALQQDVKHLALHRTARLDIAAMLKFQAFIRQENIRLLHVHGSSVFFGRMASLLRPVANVRVIWHDHYGRCEFNDRHSILYRFAVTGASGVIAVNRQLVEWACQELHMSPRRVWYVPNFVKPSFLKPDAGGFEELPGVAGFRIVCLANLRPQKDHGTLIRALAIVCTTHPQAHLLLVGGPLDSPHAELLRQEVARHNLQNNVSFLGTVPGAASILRRCDIGVLSSVSEGLPLSLLEYGWAGLPSIASSVGQCAEVLDSGRAGILCEPGSIYGLAGAIQCLLDSPVRRAEYGREFQAFVRKTFDPTAIMNRICSIYDLVLSEN